MLHEVAEFENVIISCGGGTPCFYNNIDYMNEQGETIYLKALPEVLFKHIKMTRVPRPLLKDKSPEEVKEFIKEQIAYREPFYLKAKHVFDINLLDTKRRDYRLCFSPKRNDWATRLKDSLRVDKSKE